VLFGLACVAKFSAVFLLPDDGSSAPRPCCSPPGGRAGRILLSAAGPRRRRLLVIWAFYGFRYSAFNPALPAADQFIESWDVIYAHTGAIGGVIHGLARLHALPEAFLYGAAYVVQTSQVRGVLPERGVQHHRLALLLRLVVCLLKTTLPFLLAGRASPT
jgi:hypothetical protein